MARFKINDNGIIVDKQGSKRYYNDFTEEELKELPECPYPGKRFCYFNTEDNEWVFDYTYDGD